MMVMEMMKNIINNNNNITRRKMHCMEMQIGVHVM